MSAWTQIVVKGDLAQATAALTAHCISPNVARVLPTEWERGPIGRVHLLVPAEGQSTANLMHWFNEAMDQPGQGPLHPGTLLWFGPFIANAERIKSLRRVSDYATLGTPIAEYLSEM